MKTVYHWRNIGRTVIILICVALPLSLVSTYFKFAWFITIPLGFFVGVIVTTMCLRRWKHFHFE